MPVWRGFLVVLSVLLKLLHLLFCLKLLETLCCFSQGYEDQTCLFLNINAGTYFFTYKTQLMDTITYPFCTLHLPPFPFSLCCECHPPCRGRLWPGTSTQNLWSQRIAPGTLPPHVSSLGCYLEHLWPDRLLQATTWRIRSGFRNSNTGTLTVA